MYVAAFAVNARLVFGDRPKQITYSRMLWLPSIGAAAATRARGRAALPAGVCDSMAQGRGPRAALPAAPPPAPAQPALSVPHRPSPRPTVRCLPPLAPLQWTWTKPMAP